MELSLYLCKKRIRMNADLLIGATSSGCGKTTFTIGLLRALRNRGCSVQPFKCGPDYIDSHFHKLAAGIESVNLDSWFSSKENLHRLYHKYQQGSQICVVEGVMGLFDGYDDMRGSSAEIALELGIPVILLVNACSVAYSVAPLLYGYIHFFPHINIKGVVFNQTASASQEKCLKSACKDVGVECLGFIPRVMDIDIPSRHLGLTLDREFRTEQLIDKISRIIDEHVDIQRLLELCGRESDVACNNLVAASPRRNLKIAVACDEAFNFIYKENIESLKKDGEVLFFSPLNDEFLPQADLVYLPGGYPEFFLKELSSNKTMIDSIKNHVERGGKIFAECGGMMYLCRSVVGMDNIAYPMVGIYAQDATMTDMHLHLGYRKFFYNGEEWRGHEFHFSSIAYPGNDLKSIAQQFDADGNAVNTPILTYKNAIAGYTHLYWGDSDLLKLWS